MIYMFNELSVQETESKQIARLVLADFVNATVRATELGFTELRLYEKALPNLYSISLHGTYNIDHWLNDREVGKDLQDRFRLLVTSSPLIRDEEFREFEFYSRSEFFKKTNDVSHQVWGMGAAHIYNTLSIGLSTTNDWRKNLISIQHYYLNQNGDDNINQVTIRHISNIQTLETHLEWWEKLKFESLKKSAELWDRREEFFPNLIFCQEVKTQLQKIGVSKTLSQIIERLRSLDQYTKLWSEGSFSYEDTKKKTNLRISPESQSTINKFGTQRKFFIPGLGKILFDLHIKAGDLRFHFYPDNNTKKIYIGYIGKHLRIASEN